jgi:hypothetical protein
MSGASARRVSLVLPVDSAQASLAAIRVALYLLRTMRVELDLLRGAAADEAGVATSLRNVGTVVFVTAITDTPDGRPVSDPAFEAEVRARIGSIYARFGISNVEYEIEIL